MPSSVKFKYGELAEYLGVNRTALYRAIAKLRKSGKIRIDADTLALAPVQARKSRCRRILI